MYVQCTYNIITYYNIIPQAQPVGLVTKYRRWNIKVNGFRTQNCCAYNVL